MRQAFIRDAVRIPFGCYALCTMCIGVGLASLLSLSGFDLPADT
jgi:hypothetical protein